MTVNTSYYKMIFSKQDLVCESCGQVFSNYHGYTKSIIKKHLFKSDEVNYEYICKNCGKKYVTDCLYPVINIISDEEIAEI